MKNFFWLAATAFLFAACKPSKSVTTTSEDKALLSAIKKFNKKPEDAELKKSVIRLYNNAAKIHLDKIEVYNSLTEPDRWDKIIAGYEALNDLNELISTSEAANHLLKVASYSSALLLAKQSAAAEYYELGNSLFNNKDKESFRKAYYDFKKAGEFVPGFKDSRQKMDIAYKNSIINVVIYPPVSDNSFYSSVTINSLAITVNNDNFNTNLVKDMGGHFDKKSHVLFYTDRDASKDNIHPDLEIDLTWTNILTSTPSVQQTSNTISRQIAGAKDTSGKVTYESASGTLTRVIRRSLVSATMEVRITNTETKYVTNLNQYIQYTWQQEYADFVGDWRAVEGRYDRALFNNTDRYSMPNNNDILNELARRVYLQIKNRIYASVRQ